MPLEAVIHNETYKDYSVEEIEKLYSEKESLEETKELIRINETENLAQIFTDKRYVKKDNLTFSKLYLEVLKQQGFMNHDD